MKLEDLDAPVDTVVREAIFDLGMQFVNNGKRVKGYPDDLVAKASELEVAEEVANYILKALSKDYQYKDLKDYFIEMGILSVKSSSSDLRYFVVEGFIGEDLSVEEIDEDQYIAMQEDDEYDDVFSGVTVVKSLRNLGSVEQGIPNLPEVLNSVNLYTDKSIQVYDGEYLLVTNTPYEGEKDIPLEDIDEIDVEGIDVFLEDELLNIMCDKDSELSNLRIPLKKYLGLSVKTKKKLDYLLEENFSTIFLKYDSNTDDLLILGEAFTY